MASKKKGPAPPPAFKVVGLAGDLYEFLWQSRRGEETPNDVLRRLLRVRGGKRDGPQTGPAGWTQRGKASASVRLDGDVYRRIQEHAVPLEDSTADVLRRLLKKAPKKG